MKKPINYSSLLRIAALSACVGIAIQAFQPSFYKLAAQESHESNISSSYLEFISENGRRVYSPYNDSFGVILFEATINGQRTWGILDTGSDATVIDVSLLRSQGVQLTESETRGRAIKGEFAVSRASGVEFIFNGQFKLTSDFYAVDLSGASKRLERPIGVILGMDYLDDAAFILDTVNKRIRITGPRTAPSSSAENVIELHLSGQALQGAINGVPAELKVDTGSNSPISVLTNSWDKYFPDGGTISIGQSTDITGTASENRGLEDVRIEIGPLTLTTTVKRLEATRDGSDGYVGYPALQVGTLLFNYPKNRIYIIPRKELIEANKPE